MSCRRAEWFKTRFGCWEDVLTLVFTLVAGAGHKPEVSRVAPFLASDPDIDAAMQYGKITPNVMKDAIKRRDLPCVQYLLSLDIPLNYPRKYREQTYLAMSRKAPEIMAELLLLRPSLNARHIYSGATALMFAAFGGHIDCTRALIAAGADLNLQDRQGGTAVLTAILRSDDDIRHLHALLAAGADVNIADVHGITPLMRAMRRQEYVDALIDAGSRFDLLDNAGHSVIWYISDNIHPEVQLSYIQRMLAGMCPRHPEDLLQAIRFPTRGCYNSALWMIMDGYDVNALPFLHEAIYKRELGLLVALLAHGADVNRYSQDEFHAHMNPLSYALHWSWAESVPVLLKAGANCNPSHGPSPLVTLLEKRYMAGVHPPQEHYIVMSQLLEAGADPNFLDGRDDSPIHAAIKSGCNGSISRLLAAGANVNLVNGRGYSLLSVAAHYKRPQCIQRLLAAGATNIDHPTAFRRFTPLMRAVEEGCVESVRLLLAAGANRNLRNGFGKTALDSACWKLRAAHYTARGPPNAIIDLLNLFSFKTPIYKKYLHI
jgi:ankyrin repeat protein